MQSDPFGPGPAGAVRRRWIGRWLELLFPAPCAGCAAPLAGAPNAWFCAACWNGLPCLDGPVCARCGIPFASPETAEAGAPWLCGECLKSPPPFELARVLGPYEGALAAGIKRLKYGGQTGLAPALVERAALDRFPAALWQVDLVIPVPLHARRLRARGYNQAARLARALTGRIGGRLAEDVLVRATATVPQVGLSRTERARNVRDAFRVARAEPLAGRAVLLVDDVITTGATAHACARVLRAAGAGPVHAWALARQGLDGPSLQGVGADR